MPLTLCIDAENFISENEPAENERSEKEINCAYSGWYMTEDGRLFRCEERSDSGSSAYPIPISVIPEIRRPTAQVYTAGLSGVSPVDETKFGLTQDLAELYGEPHYDPGHLLKPVAHKPVETVVKPVEHTKPTVHHHVKPILKPVEHIKPIELKPIVYKPIIKPIEKPLVLKPIVYKPIISPIYKPLEIKPIVHKPLAIKPHHKPIHHHHGHKPCHHHTVEKPHVLLNSAHLVPNFGQDFHLGGANSLENPEFGGLHPTGHGAVNHELKDNEREDIGTLDPLHAWAPPFIPSLYPSLSYDRPYYLVPNIQTYGPGLETDERVQTILPVKKIDQDSTAEQSGNVEKELPPQSENGKTVPAIRNVIENIQQNIERIPSILGIQGPQAANSDPPTPPIETAESDSPPVSQDVINDAKIAAAVAEVAKSDASETSEANAVPESNKQVPVRRLDVPEDEIGPEAVSQVVQLVSDISSSVPENERAADGGEEPVEKAPEGAAEAEATRAQDEANETPAGNDYVLEDQDSESFPEQMSMRPSCGHLLHCSVRDMKQPEERPIGKKVHSPERATLELLAEHVAPMVDYADYYNDATEEISAEPTFLELLNVAEQHKIKSEDQ
ncbi:unnamed protein product [Nesidiocoris tenuis]|uniref:Uncharacterized protein n=1 Tax=Nesidiocoris tenuis TaxID=355587 RepID=A0A6H5GRJ5_9HEMI|nr:unnamed protein product [Nesidiocoris tenuis]